jgi:hypothetical protein
LDDGNINPDRDTTRFNLPIIEEVYMGNIAVNCGDRGLRVDMGNGAVNCGDRGL